MKTLAYLFFNDFQNSRSSVSMERSLLYCTIVSAGFVGSLYALVPRRIQSLNRDDEQQIKWRAFATCMASLGSLALYPVMIASDKHQVVAAASSIDLTAWMQSTMTACTQVLAHLTLLYIGPLIKSVLDVHASVQNRDGTENISHRHRPYSFWKVYYQSYIQPTIDSLTRPFTASERWMTLRWLVIAPMCEELVFRRCIVSALVAANLPAGKVIFASPLFFGTAHVHRATTKVNQGEPINRVIMQTAAQIAYTSLFGMYASYAYLQTNSVLAVTLGHSFCNAMGLPSVVSFCEQGSLLYKRRYELGGAHAVGLAGFLVGMKIFLPGQRQS
ncbi:hypothetical protein MPSEU_001095800 [Mayamaea pseudoterrestris]|nr:hypothetical protein MPSEU_001095800 [Mayamaea pseudoterrestris]